MDRSEELDKMKEKVDNLSESLKDFAEKTEKRMLSEDSETKIKEKLQEAKQTAKEAGEHIQTFVKEKPWHAAAIAAGIGFLAGLVSLRGRKKS